MRAKKNTKADLNRYRLIFFQIGMIITLLITYTGIEWTFYQNSEIQDEQFTLDIELTEDIPVTEMKTNLTPPPPPPVVPEVIEIVDDQLDIEETEIQSTETSINDKMEDIIEVSEVKEQKMEEVVEDVPFVLIANVPVYPGCEKEKDNDSRKKCMSEKIQKHVKDEFNTSLGAELGLSGINRIFVVFKIDSSGNISDIRSRGPHQLLEEEAERVVKLLPHMTPGYQRNRPVGVIYTLPIVFEVRPGAI